MARAFKTVALRLARAASDKKGENIAVLHVGKTSPVTDYMLIVTANSRPHLESLEAEIDKAADALGLRCLRRSKPASDQWRVLDFGGLLVHLMTEESRGFYALEKLYHEAPRLKWEEKANA
jgi:ribosome-associated protein